MKASPTKFALTLLTVLSAQLTQVAQAANDTWNKTTAGTYSWDANANWVSTTQFPNGIDNVANVNINIAAPQTNNLNQVITVGTLNLGDSTSSYFPITIGAGTAGSLTFDVTSGNALLARTVTVNPSVNDVINANVTLNDPLTVSVPWATGGGNNGAGNGIQINGVVSGAGSIMLVNPASASGSSSQLLDLVNTNNSFTGNVEVANGLLTFRGNVLTSQNSALGNSSSAVKIGNASSQVPASANSATQVELRLKAGDDTSNYSFNRGVDFSGTTAAGSFMGRARFTLIGDAAGGANSNTLTVGGNITLTSTNRGVEFMSTRAGQTIYFTNNISTPAGANGSIYYGPGNQDSSADGPFGGAYRFSDMSRSYTNSRQTLTCGTIIIEGSVGASGTASPIGAQTIDLSDGNGGCIAMVNGQDGKRSVFLATPGASFARTLSPAGGAGIGNNYNGGTFAFNVYNGYQFGGVNTNGTVTFSGAITSQDPNIGINSTNQVITLGQNFALIQAAGGTAKFAGVISDTPNAATVTRITINQFRNHSQMDTNLDGVPDPGLANALVGTATGGTVILSATNTYEGGTEVLGGTLLVNSATGSGTGSGAVTVQSGATLGGTGRIAGAVTFNAGSHAVFTNGAVLSFSNALIIATSGTIPDVHLNLSNNVPVGNYTLATNNPTGSSGVFNSTPVIDSGSLAANTVATIVTSGGNVVLQITAGSAATTLALASSVNPSISGQSVTFTAIVKTNGVTATAATSNIVFQVDAIAVATNGVSSGQATYSTSALAIGAHTITATYLGDANYFTSTTNLTQTVSQTAKASYAGNPEYNSTSIQRWRDTTVAKPMDIDGDNVWGTAGYVMFGTGFSSYNQQFPNNVLQSTNTLVSLPVGTTLTNGWSPFNAVISDGWYPNIQDPAATNNLITLGLGVRTVSGTGQAFVLTMGTNTPGVGSPNAKMRVGFWVWNPVGQWFGTGPTSIRLITPSSDTGNIANQTGAWGQVLTFFDITNYYAGDQVEIWLNNTNTGCAIQGMTFDLVNPTTTTTALAASVNPSTYGQSVTFTATLKTNGVTASAASSNFVFQVDGIAVATNALAGGQATFSMSSLTSGAHTITATYQGSVNYASSTTNLTQNVNQATSTATVAVNNSPATYNGAGRAATVTLSGTNTAGSVQNILTGGQTLQTNVGTYAVTASFVPNDTNYTTLTGLSAGNFTITNAVTTNSILVYGSSVAYGIGSSSGALTNGSMVKGYAGLMTSFLASKGWVVTNASLPGDSSTGAVSRFPSVVVPIAPNYVLIGYSLGNDGLAGTTDPTSATIVTNFTANIQNVISQCRSNGYYPVVASVYTRNDYTASNYANLKAMNVIMNTWNVPSLNFLGTIDDNSGHWINGYWYDSLHPNDLGHQEMFYSLVPSLFDAIAAGKTNSPQLSAVTNFARLTQNAGVTAPITFTPTNTMHSFTMSFRVRSTNSGTIAAVRAGANYATLQITNGQVVYVSATGQQIVSSINATNGDWHDIALACRYALTNTALMVDGTLAGNLTEQYVPDQFTLGGPSASGRAATPATVDFQNWCVYRSAWSLEEAQAQMQGNRQQASMEICAALDDASFTSNNPAANRAQSLSVAMVNTANLSAVQSVTPPSNLGAQYFSATAAKLSWTPNSTTESGFVLERRVTGTTVWSDVVLLPAGSTSYTNSGLTAGVSYDYRVAALEGGLRGNYSNIATFIPGFGSHQTILVDFGPNDGAGANGVVTASPDYLGQYWNNIVGAAGGASLSTISLTNLITTSNAATTIGLNTSASGWQANGIQNGGLLTPSYALLGSFGVTNATEDYFYTTTGASVTLTNLDAALNYRVRLFGTRNNTDTRVTRYIVTGGNGSFTNNLTTTGTGIGAGGYNGNNNTIASINGVIPNGSNQIQVGVSIVSGGFAYLGIMELMLNHAPVPQAISVGATVGQTISIDVINGTNAPTDADGDGFAVSAVSGPLIGGGTATTNGGTGFTYIATAAGTNQFSYSVTDVYGGTGTNTVTVVVAKGTPIVQTAPTASAITYGQTLASSIVTGAVFTNLAGATVPMASTNFVLPGMVPTAGTTNVQVYFMPTDAANYNNVTNTVTVTVNQASTAIVVSSTSQTNGYHDSVSFTATLPAAATGNVIFKANASTFSTSNLVGGVAGSLPLANLPRGTNFITAEYVGDGNFIGSTNTLNQIVTNHPPVANAKSYSATQGGSITIPVASGAKSLATDTDGDPLVVISIGDTNAVDYGTAAIGGGGTSINYTNTGGSSGLFDTFSYTVSDGFGGLATNTISVRLESAQGYNRISAVNLGGNTLAFSYLGIPGTNYALDWATNLSTPINWMPVATNAAQTNGWLYFTNTGIGTDFYRTRYVP